MSETKTIDMSVCIGSDTLCEYGKQANGYFKLEDYDPQYGQPSIYQTARFSRGQVAQNEWMSTSNNIVIPEGLICDVQYIDVELQDIATYSGLNSSDADFKKQISSFLAIRVTGIAEGWSYAWQQDQRGGE